MLIYFLLFLLGAVGITNIIVNASILEGMRQFLVARSVLLGKLITCMLCSGFWVGWSLSFFDCFNPYHWNGFLLAGAVSVISYTFELVKEYLEVSIAVKALNLPIEEEVESEGS